tara:strand:- start:44 stop:328 length:285 start_codon:yes stop_codon:yes gene_type:complete
MSKEKNLEAYCEELSKKGKNMPEKENKLITPSFIGQLIHTSVLEKELNITSNTRRDWVMDGILPTPIKLKTQLYFINDELTELLINKKRANDTN